ncbi:MAG: hypothetical protein IT371_29055 [Deltaproteobacteria bacterium]|nr:hypothetical protein [Deltaproteobacteria bacterium]
MSVLTGSLLSTGCASEIRPVADGGGGGPEASVQIDGRTPDAPLPDSRIDGPAVDAAAPADAAIVADTARPCGLVVGENKNFTIGGRSRRFFIELVNVPSGHAKPLPVVFAYHYLGGTPEDFRKATVPSPANKPFILAMPAAVDKTKFPMWDFKTDPATSVDLKFFDEMLVCLSRQFTIDTNRIHAMGFSMGAQWINYLVAHRGDLLASFAQASGGVLSLAKTDPNYFECPMTTLLGKLAKKPAGLVAWGGANDKSDTYSFHQGSLDAIKLYHDSGHFLVRCTHAYAHNWPPDDFTKFILMFFEDHPKGVNPEPYVLGLPKQTPFSGPYPSWPTWCAAVP